MAANGNGLGSSIVKCTVCLDEVSDLSDRTFVKLRCSHVFHLDCIGSAFNVKGAMECPNCREIESGVWRRFEDEDHEANMDQETNDEDDVEFEMLTNGIRCPHGGWVMGLPSPGDQNAMGQRVNPNIQNINYHHNCDYYIDLVAHPVVLDHGTQAQTLVDSSIGLGNQGNSDQVYQSLHWTRPLSNSPSPVVRASMSSNMRRPDGLWGRLPAGERPLSVEEFRNANHERAERIANMTDQELQAEADLIAHRLLLERLDFQLNEMKERLQNEFHFIPDHRDPSPDA
ncbi:E3 ubiquitin-ligase [Fagus crenata]